MSKNNIRSAWLDSQNFIFLRISHGANTFKTSRGWHTSVLTIPAAAPATATGEIQEREKFKLTRPICILGHSVWFHVSCADVIVRFTHSNVPSSIAWVGIMRSILIALPAHNPCQPCWSITSTKLPTICLDPTPTTILVLNISHVIIISQTKYFNTSHI